MIGACAAAGCASKPVVDPVSADEYAVYNAFLSQFPCGRWIDRHYVVDQSFVIYKHRHDYTAESERGFAVGFDSIDHNFSQEMIEDFYGKNVAASRLNFSRKDWGCISFVDEEEAVRIATDLVGQHDKDREQFEASVRARAEGREFTQAPITLRSVHRLSRCGFDAGRRQAIFVSHYYCGRLCMEIHLNFANRFGSDWGVVDNKLLLIS